MFFKKRSKPVTQARADMEPAELLKQVASLAKQGLTQKQTAEQLGLKTIFTLNTRLVKASQATGKPVPAFRQTRKSQVPKWVETVVVKRRGKGDAFGLNIPQEPLTRAGAKPRTRLSVNARKRRIVLTVQ